MYGLGLWYGNKILLDDKESLEFKLCVDNCTMDATNIVVYCMWLFVYLESCRVGIHA